MKHNTRCNKIEVKLDSQIKNWVSLSIFNVSKANVIGWYIDNSANEYKFFW